VYCSITDVIGHKFPNVQLIADQFAANGYFVMMPDVFDGDPIPLNRPGDFDLMKWLNGAQHPKGRAHLPINVDPVVDACIIKMKELGVKVSYSLFFALGTRVWERERMVLQELRDGMGMGD
jgi:dienelactone hydrolase